MTRIANAYAEALFALACEEGIEQEALAALKEILTVMEEEPELEALLSSPAIPKEERVAVTEKMFDGRMPSHVTSFLCLLCEKRRVGLLPECVREYERLWNERRAVVTAVVSSAVPLSEEEREALKRNLEKKSGHTVSLVCRVDPTLLGGVVVEMEGTMTDGSLRHRLHQIKEGLNR